MNSLPIMQKSKKLKSLAVFLILLLIIPVYSLADYMIKAQDVRLNTANFDNNLESTDNDVQKLAEKVDDMAGGSGEANTASNTGSAGTGIFKQKTGVDLEFFKLSSANSLLAIGLEGTDYVKFTVDNDLHNYSWTNVLPGDLPNISSIETDPVFGAWDGATGINWTAFPNDQGYITDINWNAIPNYEEDPVFGAWDGATGINWTAFPNDQGYITDINWNAIPNYEEDPVFGAWDGATGINWTAFPNDQGYITDINWNAIPNYEEDPVFGAWDGATGINWDAFPNAQGYLDSINWDAMPTIQGTGINWDSIVNEEMYATGINWEAFYVPDSSINWDSQIPLGETDPIVGAVSGLVKSDGAGNISAASAGSDYLSAETNDLETDGATGIADTEIFIGTGAGTGNYASLTGVISLTNAGVTDYVANSITDPAIDDDGNFAFTGKWDFGGGDLEVPNGATVADPNVAGEVAIDTTSDQLLYYGSAQRVLTYKIEESITVEDLAAADDGIPFGSKSYARTVTQVGCRCIGTCTTKAEFSFSDSASNAFTLSATPTCATTGAATYVNVTNGGGLSAGEGMLFNVTNAVSPETDWYEIMWVETVDAD